MTSGEMTGGMRVEVTLIGGQKLEFSVGARLQTQELVTLVASHYALRDAHYFSLAYRNSSGHHQWLIENLRLLDHEFARGVKVLPLSFLVKYYPESAIELRDPQAVEIFYHHAKDAISKGSLLADKNIVCKLSAYSLHISHGDFLDKSTIRVLLKNSSLLPSRFKDDAATLDSCLNNVHESYSQLKATTRGEAILKYMREVEGVPGYGVHYYDVKDRYQSSCLLGLSRTGIAEYEPGDKHEPRQEFLWQQLENLYIREKKFSIEVHTPNRAWDQPEDCDIDCEIYLSTIPEDFPELPSSRRPFWPANVQVHAWLCDTQQLCKDVWSMAIAQHQFYLERKTIKGGEGMKDSFDLAGELSKSCLSLSAQSSPSISRSGSHSSIHQNSIADDTASTESLAAARLELMSALQQRHDALQQRLNEKTKELKLICMKEGELTGELPPEYPLTQGEALPVVRKRVGTSFLIDEAMIAKLLNKQDETVSGLELEYEIQTKIATAALKLANESSMRKRLRKQRKQSYQQALTKLKEIERKLKLARGRQLQTSSSSSTMPKMKKKPRPFSDSDGTPDDTYGSRGPSCGVRSCDYMETSLLNTSHASVSSTKSYKVAVHHASHVLPDETQLKKNLLQSAPPSPLVGSSAADSDSSSSHNAVSEGSRASSPGRPVSGYIPSGVYTRSQYRSQHFPTLSTRGQSVPLEVPQDQSFTRAVFNVPQQRGSIVSHSMDDLDTSVTKSPLITTSHQSPHVNPQSPHVTTPQSPHQYKFHHHHYDHHSRRPVGDSQERYGSLDRRRVGSGRYESRSMEQLNDGSGVPPQNASTPAYPITPSCAAAAYPYRSGPAEGETFPGYANGLGTTHSDVVDATPRRSHSVARSRQLYVHLKGTPEAPEPVQRMGRAANGRLEAPFPSPNQENIPPGGSQRNPKAELCPRPISGDRQRPYGVPVNELPPLRATQSTVDLPPLKATNQHQVVSRAVNMPVAQTSLDPPSCRSYGEEPLLSLAEAARTRKGRRTWASESSTPTMGDQAKLPQLTPRLDCSRVEPAEMKMCLPPQTSHNLSSSSSGGSSCSVFPAASPAFPGPSPPGEPLGPSLNATLTVDSPGNHMLINVGTFQPSREVSKPFEMSDFYKYSTKYRRQSASHLPTGDISSDSCSPMPKDPSSKYPPSPSVVARHSSPAPQQKGLYQPPALMTCQPISKISSGLNVSPEGNVANLSTTSWEGGSQVHQALPATVTTKRAATLV